MYGDGNVVSIMSGYSAGAEGVGKSQTWEADTRGKSQPDACMSGCYIDPNATRNPADSIFRTGFEGTRFEESFTISPDDNRFIPVGQNMWINSNYISKTPDVVPTPPRHNFDLNSPYGGSVDVVSSDNCSYMFASVTPDQLRRTEKIPACSSQMAHKQLPKSGYDVSSENFSSMFAPITPEQYKKTGGSQFFPNQTAYKELSEPINVVSSENFSSVFAPITSDQSKKTGNNQFFPKQMAYKELSEPINVVSSENSSSLFAPITPDKYKQVEESLPFSNSMTDEQIANRASCAAVSTQVENPNPNNDPLTTPEPKPKRKKHRPKVVKEGQAKRARKPATPNPEGNMETPTRKRNYVRKNGVDKTPGLPEATAQSVENKDTPKMKRKYVRKSGVNKTPELANEVSSKCTVTESEPLGRNSCKKRLNFDETNLVIEGNSSFGAASNEKAESQAQNFHIGVESQSPLELSRNSKLIKKKESNLVQGVEAQKLTETRKGKCHIIYSDETHDKRESAVGMMMNRNAQPAPTLNYLNCSTYLYEGGEVRALKRGREVGAEKICTNVHGSHFNSMSTYVAQFPAYAYGESTLSDINFPNTGIKTQSKQRHSAKEATAYTSHSAYMTSYVPETNRVHPAVKFCPNYYQNGTQSLLHAHLQQQSLEYRLLMEHARTMRENISNSVAQPCNFSSQVDHVKRNHMPYYAAGGAMPCGDLQIYQSPPPGYASTEIKVAKTRNQIKNGRKVAAVARKKKPTVDDITEYLEHLHIDLKIKEPKAHIDLKNKEQKALVLYAGVQTLVPFEGPFNPVKKRKERAKVDLDEETSRVWRLLLENINSEGIDGTDEEKAKWWEEERRVFQGRADSFIARMHLVQGDRRFSPWKGSVVDSVVGVFLTQNVSDHASSSAFMSLAAHFPLKTEDSSGSCSKEEEVHILEPEDSINFSDPKQSSTTFMELLQMAESGKQFYNQGSQCMPSYTEEVRRSLNFELGFYNSSTSLRPIISPVEKIPSHERCGEENSSSTTLKASEENCASEQSEITVESKSPDNAQNVMSIGLQTESISANYCVIDNPQSDKCEKVETSVTNHGSTAGTSVTSEQKKGKAGKQKKYPVDWDMLRLKAQEKVKREKTAYTMDSLDWEAVRRADVAEVAQTFKARGMSNVLAERIQAFLNRIVTEHGSIDLEWLRDVPPDKAKEYLLSIRGLGLKSVECVRLLTLHHLAFPVDTNVGRIAVRLGWVPLQPLPESLQLHLLELYPVLESIQQYLWPRLCKLDQRTLYELHYQLITFGKVFCTKSKPNCNACPMRGECRHFASAFASARLALPGPEEKRIVNAAGYKEAKQSPYKPIERLMLPEPQLQPSQEPQAQPKVHIWTNTPIVEEPIVEIPSTPEPEIQVTETDMEDMFLDDPEEIPTIRLNLEKFTENLQSYMENNMELQEGEVSKALVAISQEAASIPMPKLKNVNSLRTEHQVYELPDTHPLLKKMDKREPDDPCSYLLAIWTPGETPNSFEQPESRCSSQESGNLCEVETCFSCNSIREANSHTVRGTILIPCRTATRGSFPLNGTYFQVNEVFADHESSLKPINVPRSWIWNLPRRTVYFGTSISTIFKGLSTEDIQYCFWRGFICVRGFDQKTRAPRPLMARLHFPASKLPKTSNKPEERKI